LRRTRTEEPSIPGLHGDSRTLSTTGQSAGDRGKIRLSDGRQAVWRQIFNHAEQVRLERLAIIVGTNGEHIVALREQYCGVVTRTFTALSLHARPRPAAAMFLTLVTSI
jgi:hypothetical protein